MLLEDLDDHGGGALRPDLEQAAGRGDRLLASLDAVVDLSDGGAGRVEGGADPASAMVADLLEAIRPGGPGEADRARREGSSSSTTTRATATCWRAAWRARATGRSRRARAARPCRSSSSRTSTWSCSTW
jgi:hypothetical protein